MDPYATHLPHLVRAVLMTGGPVLELGMGDYSTPLLLQICRLQGRRLLSVENSWSWFHKFNFEFDEPLRQCQEIGPNWECFAVHPDAQFSVMFIDLHPPELRPKILESVWNRGDIIVAHDSEALTFDWTRFKYRHEYTSMEGPRTMLASNVIDVTDQALAGA